MTPGVAQRSRVRPGSRILAWAGLGLVLAACLEPGSSRCPSGRLCPPGTICEDVARTDLSFCLHTTPTWCAFQDPDADTPCASGMVCHEQSRLCLSLSQFEACADLGEGDSCELPGFPADQLICRGRACILPYCGDGVTDEDEGCDDGNEAPTDGCSPLCEVEPGWTCAGVPSVCTFDCGDGVVVPGEACDDGNATAGDGCSPTCEVERGWSCAGEPSQCATTCGDGLRAGAEACDGTELGGATCASRGFDLGVLRCDAACAIDETACAAAVEIPAGTFIMGSPVAEPGRNYDESQHEVTLTRSYLLQDTEVTQHQFQTAMGYNPSFFTTSPDLPVETVTWYEAVAYLNALSDAEALDRCYTCSGAGSTVLCEASDAFAIVYDCPGYRLPTEAEWEHAARAGTAGGTYHGTSALLGCEQPNEVLDPIAWFCGNAQLRTHPVRSLTPSPWGLFDPLGNVWEWVHDWFEDYQGDGVDPWGPEAGSYRVYRGGGYLSNADYTRAASRSYDGPSFRVEHLGFRPARSL